MQPNISRILFHSLIFATGAAPTGAIWIIKYNQVEFTVSAFAILSIVLAAFIAPLILIQNTYLYFKREDENLDAKLVFLVRFYMALNAICLLSWIIFSFQGY